MLNPEYVEHNFKEIQKDIIKLESAMRILADEVGLSMEARCKFTKKLNE